MKKLLFLLSIVLASMGFTLQEQDAETTAMIDALKKADAALLSVHFDTYIDLKLTDKDELKNISQNQAKMALSNFFESKKISGFKPTSQREMGDIMYIAGKLNGKESDYNLSLMIKRKGDKRNIISIRIN